MTHPSRSVASQPRAVAALTLASLVVVLAACGPSLSLPSAAASGGASSMASAPPSAGASRPAPGTPAPHDAAIQAFVDRVTGGLTYRTEFEGRVAGSANLGRVSGHVDTDGTDFAARYDYDFRGDAPGIEILTAGFREVDGTGYLRIEDQQGWDEIAGYTETDAAIPFRAITSPADVRLVGTGETEDGEPRYTVELTRSMVLHPWTIPGLLADERIRGTTLVLTIDGEGRPLEGTWELDSTGRVGRSGQLQQLTADLEVVFSRLGDEMTFEAP